MSRLTSLLYPPLLWVQRHTTRRDFLHEIQFQRQFRKESPAQQQAYAFHQAVAHANRMRKVIPAYDKLLTEAGCKYPIAENLDDWRKLPILTKNTYQHDTESWLSTVIDRETVHWSCTAGSTGDPFKFPLAPDCMLAETVGNELNLRSVGWDPSWVSAVLKVELKAFKGFRKFVRNLMGNTPVGISAFNLTPDKVPDIVQRINSAGVKFLRGYSSSVYLLADEILKRGFKVSVPLLETIGEELPPKRAEVIEKAFGGKVYRDYGGSEAMHVGWECRERNGYHLHLSRFYIEVLNEDRPVKPGEVGDIVLTDYRNNAIPLIRYRIGDAARLANPEDICPCGNNSPRFLEVIGRTSDIVYTPKGQAINLHLFFAYLFEYAHEHLRRVRVIQKAIDHLHILWVPGHDNSEIILPDLEGKIREQTGQEMKVTWKKVADIPPEPSGKRTSFVPLRSAMVDP